MTVEQTSRVIKFGGDGGGGSTQREQRTRSNGHYSEVPTPTKFVQGQFRESDYESDMDTSRIRAKWAPSESENEEPRYRKVSAPKVQHSRSPIITLPSDTETDRSESERRSNFVQESSRSRQTSGSQFLQPGSPPEFAYAPAKEFRKSANRKPIP